MANIVNLAKISKYFSTKVAKISKCFSPKMAKISKCLPIEVRRAVRESTPQSKLKSVWGGKLRGAVPQGGEGAY